MKELTDLIQFERPCPRCKEVKAMTDFPRNRTRPDGRASYCKVCQREILNAYYATERGRVAIRESQARSLARRKAAYDAAVAALPPEDRARLGVV